MRHRSRRMVWIMAVALAVGAAACPHDACARAPFTIEYLDGPGEGFYDPSPSDPASTIGGNSGFTLGAQRRIAFQFAVDIWTSQINSNVTIVVEANFDSLACNNTQADLGAAGTITVHRDFFGAQIVNTWYPAALANAQAGFDLEPNQNDIRAEFNSDLDGACAFPRQWYYGLDGNPPGDRLDFVSIALHELAHGLGFQTFMDDNGAKLNGFDDVFLLWLENHSSGELLSDMASNANRVAASTNTGNLHWVGPNVIADGGGLTAGRHPSGHVEMYAPDPFEPRSSVSHFSTALSPNELMEPFYTQADHDVGLALALMDDIGWSIDRSGGSNVFGASSGGGGGGGGCFIGVAAGF